MAFEGVNRHDRRQHTDPTGGGTKLEVDHLAGQSTEPSGQFAAALSGRNLEPTDGVAEPAGDLIDAAHHEGFAADGSAQFAAPQLERNRKTFAATDLPMNAGLGDLEVQVLAEDSANTTFEGVLVEFCTNVEAVGLATDAANDVEGRIDLTHNRSIPGKIAGWSLRARNQARVDLEPGGMAMCLCSSVFAAAQKSKVIRERGECTKRGDDVSQGSGGQNAFRSGVLFAGQVAIFLEDQQGAT
jgi:hypothetical protein